MIGIEERIKNNLDNMVIMDMNNPDKDMEIYLTIHDDGTPFIIHDAPFTESISWIEYHINTNQIDYITDSGEIRNFGIQIHPSFGAAIQDKNSIALIHMVNGKALGGDELSLIIQQ